MRGFIIGTLATAVTFAIVAYLLPQIDYGDNIPSLIVVALIAGVVNGFIKPIIKLFSLPLTLMTFGLFGLVINAGLLLLIAWVSSLVGITFTVGGFPPDLVDRRDRRRGDRWHRHLDRRGPRRHGGPGLTLSAPTSGGTPGAPPRRFGTPVFVTDLATLAAACADTTAAFPDPIVRQYSVKANDVPAVIARRRPSAASGRMSCRAGSGRWRAEPASRTSASRSRAIGKTPADLRAAARAARDGEPLRWIALESPEEAEALADGGDPRRCAAHRRPVPAQPRCRARDADRPRRRSRGNEVRDDRDGDRDGDRGRWRPRRPAPARAASTSMSGRSSVRSMRGATPCARRWRWPPSGAARSRRSTRSTSAAASRSVRPTNRHRARNASRASSARCSTAVPERPPPDAPGDRARTRARRPGRLARRPRPPCARPRRTPGDPGRRDDRAHPAGAVRRAPPDRRVDVARPSGRCDARTGRHVPGARRGPDLRIDRLARDARPPAAAARGPRGDRRRRRVRGVARFRVQRAPAAAAGPPRHGRGVWPSAGGVARSPLSADAPLCCGPWSAPSVAGRSRPASLFWPCSAWRCPASPRRAGPPFPDPVDGQAVYDTAELFSTGNARAGRAHHRRDRGPDEGRGRRLHAGSRPRRHHDRGGRGRRRGAHGPMGRRPDRAERRAGHPVRPRHDRCGTGRSSCMPARASRRRTCRTRSARRSTRGRCSRSWPTGTSTTRSLAALARGRQRDVRRVAAGVARGAERPGHRPRAAVPGARGRSRCVRLRRHPVGRARSSGPNRRSMPSRRGPRPRSSSTPSSSTTACRQGRPSPARSR